jgi:hypothetical protein
MSTTMILGAAIVVFTLMLVGLFLTAREASKWDDPATHKNKSDD